MGAFDVIGVVSDDFDTRHKVIHVPKSGEWKDGVWVETPSVHQDLVCCVQPMSEKEIGFLNNGGERIVDARKVFATEPITDLSLDSKLLFLGLEWKVYRYDARPENNYFKIIATRVDE